VTTPDLSSMSARAAKDEMERALDALDEGVDATAGFNAAEFDALNAEEG